MNKHALKIYDEVMSSKENIPLTNLQKIVVKMVQYGLNIGSSNIKWFSIKDNGVSNILDKSSIIDK